MTGFTWSRWSSRTPDPGSRTPDSRTGSSAVTDTVTVTETDTDTVTVTMGPVTTEPTVSFPGDRMRLSLETVSCIESADPGDQRARIPRGARGMANAQASSMHGVFPAP